ncbi:hypothetical protein RHGRI_010403 [Rhododendron griersonianum]|uniref:Uncharacterized protein n=1 Tax=Rhododendron griersonianum TaxID=479676 RepID=A0AAV6KJ73_9ERIC|nr:hypothetical protein RHGRI_010403 [Rhododendron griersonianum]
MFGVNVLIPGLCLENNTAEGGYGLDELLSSRKNVLTGETTFTRLWFYIGYASATFNIGSIAQLFKPPCACYSGTGLTDESDPMPGVPCIQLTRTVDLHALAQLMHAAADISLADVLEGALTQAVMLRLSLADKGYAYVAAFISCGGINFLQGPGIRLLGFCLMTSPEFMASGFCVYNSLQVVSSQVNSGNTKRITGETYVYRKNVDRKPPLVVSSSYDMIAVCYQDRRKITIISCFLFNLNVLSNTFSCSVIYPGIRLQRREVCSLLFLLHASNSVGVCCGL